MPDRLTRLTNLGINRVALVPKGDNPKADLLLWKSADPEHKPPSLGAREDKNVSDLTKEPRLTQQRRGALEAARDAIAGVLGIGDGKETGVSDTYVLPEDADDALKAFVEGLQKERDEAVAKAEAAPAVVDEPKDDEADAITKALADPELSPVAKAALEQAQAMTKAADERSETAMTKVDALEKAQRHAAAIEKAASLKYLGKDEELATTIEKLREGDGGLAGEVEVLLDRANALASEAFAEIGKDGQEAPEAETKIDTMAKELSAKENIPYGVAYTKVLESPEGKAAHAEANAEKEDAR